MIEVILDCITMIIEYNVEPFIIQPCSGFVLRFQDFNNSILKKGCSFNKIRDKKFGHRTKLIQIIKKKISTWAWILIAAFGFRVISVTRHSPVKWRRICTCPLVSSCAASTRLCTSAVVTPRTPLSVHFDTKRNRTQI